MDALERGLGLVLSFVRAIEEAWDKGAEVPTGLTSDGWTVSVENKFLESGGVLVYVFALRRK
ncbi:MAG: hypothetical protein ACPLRH_05670 [Desulfotomaculales bacterium]